MSAASRRRLPRFIKTLFATGLLLSCASAGWATVITVPSDLNPGDPYRLVFWTEGTRDATSTNIGDYNNFVAAEAATVAELVSLGTAWKAIASTASIDARDNTGTNPGADGVGVPIYMIGDVRVADNNADLWDGTLAEPITNTVRGEFHLGQYTMWTGSDSSGVKHAFPLGHATQSMSGLSRLDIDDARWVESSVVAHAAEFDGRFYGLSGILAVPGAVPEPSTVVLAVVGLLGLLAYRRRR